MKVKIVDRSKIRVTRRNTSKYIKLKNALEKLEPQGDALEVKFSKRNELNSIRNIAYAYNRENGGSVKSSADISKGVIYFYVEK
ncbi:MAG: hypothetical protein WEA56_04075 [Balneolaceae bacterium]